MDMKPVIAKIVADCDLRNRFLRQFPKFLDNYLISGKGELLTREESNKSYAINFLKDGLDFVSQRVRS
jgi:hypothetical protein